MTLSDYYNRNIPEYYDTMYLDGYTPTEIMIASRKLLYRQLQEREEVDNIHITFEVKKK